MPVSGLPTMLECIINNILEESQLASYKFAGNSHRSTLVLRFDAMIDTSVSTIRQSTPAASCRRYKPPSQLLRDRNRQHNHLSALSTKKEGITTPPPEKATFKGVDTDSITDIFVPTANNSADSTRDSGPTVDSSTTDIMQAVNSTTTDRVPTVNSSTTDSMPAVNSSTTDSVPVKRSTTVSVPMNSCDMDSVLENSDQNNVDNSADVITHSEHSEHNSKEKVTEYDTPSCEDVVHYSNTHSSTNSTKSQHGHNDTADSAFNEHTRSHDYRHNNESEDDERNHESLSKNFHRADKIRLQCFKMKRETIQQVIHPDRNNTFTNGFIDSYGGKYIILLETDDLIVEYNVDSEEIVNFIVKNVDHDSPYAKRRKRQVQHWDDQLHYIQESYHDHLLNLKTALPVLKRHIDEISRY